METRNKKRLTFPNFNIRRGWGAKIRQNFLNLEIPERGVKCPSLCKRCIPFSKDFWTTIGPLWKTLQYLRNTSIKLKTFFSDLEWILFFRFGKKGMKKCWKEEKKWKKFTHTNTQSANSISSWLLKATQNNQHFC